MVYNILKFSILYIISSFYSTTSSLESILVRRFLGFSFSTVHPNEQLYFYMKFYFLFFLYHVPKTCFTVPVKLFARLLLSINFATFLTCSIERLPLCLTLYKFKWKIKIYLLFFTFFLSLTGS